LGVFRFQSLRAPAFALELQAFSLLPFQQTTELVEKLPAQKVWFEDDPRRNSRPAPLERLGHFQTVMTPTLCFYNVVTI